MVGYLGIVITDVNENCIEGPMPVDHRTLQPFGILHGGANVVLAESLGSIGSNLCIDRTRFHSVGLEIIASHISAVRNGHVIGRATPVHVGRTTHVRDIRITTPEGKLTCFSRLTMALVGTKPEAGTESSL
jgi:1,4-dihydroxy-2-naphthoyl-CoA hydrolase